MSTYWLLLLITILSQRFCGGVDFLKLINKYIVSDKNGVDRPCPGSCGTPPADARERERDSESEGERECVRERVCV